MLMLLFDPEHYPGEIVKATNGEYATLIGSSSIDTEVCRIGGKEYLVMSACDAIERPEEPVSAINESGFPRMAGMLLICNYDQNARQEKDLCRDDIERIGMRIARAVDNDTGDRIGTVVVLDGQSDHEN